MQLIKKTTMADTQQLRFNSFFRGGGESLMLNPPIIVMYHPQRLSENSRVGSVNEITTHCAKGSNIKIIT